MRIDPRADRSLIAAFGAPEPAGGVSAGRWGRPRHPAMQLLRAVMALAGAEAELIRHSERVWASVTFSGTRHSIVLGFEGMAGVAAGEAFVCTLPDHEFAICRQIVADATVAAVAHEMLPAPRMVVEAELLLLEDC